MLFLQAPPDTARFIARGSHRRHRGDGVLSYTCASVASSVTCKTSRAGRRAALIPSSFQGRSPPQTSEVSDFGSLSGSVA
jgi:hypothetical protein